MKITISLDHIDSLKPDLAVILPTLKAAHRIEALARGIGFNSYAAVRAKLMRGAAEVALTREPFEAFVRPRAGLAGADLGETWTSLSARLAQGGPARPARRRGKTRQVRRADLTAARLILVVGPVRSGKTRLTQEIMESDPSIRLFDALEGEIRSASDAGKLSAMLADGPVIANLHTKDVSSARTRLEMLFGSQLAAIAGTKTLVIATRLLGRADGDGEIRVQEAGWLGWQEERPVERMLTPKFATAAARLIDTGTVSMASAVRQFGSDIPANNPLFTFYSAPGRAAKAVATGMAVARLEQELEASGPLTLGQNRLLAMMMHMTRAGLVTGVNLQHCVEPGIEMATVIRLYRRWATQRGVGNAIQMQLEARFLRVTPQTRIQVVVRWPDLTGDRTITFGRQEADTMLKPFGVHLPPDSISDIEVSFKKDGTASVAYVLPNGNWAHAGQGSPSTGPGLAAAERRQAQLLAALPAKAATWRALLDGKQSQRDLEQNIRMRLHEAIATFKESETANAEGAQAYQEVAQRGSPVKAAIRIEDPPESIFIPAKGPIGRTCRTDGDAIALASWLAPTTSDPIWGDATQSILRGFIRGLQRENAGQWDWANLKKLCEQPSQAQRAFLDRHDPEAAQYLVFNDTGRLNRTSEAYMAVIWNGPYVKISELATGTAQF